MTLIPRILVPLLLFTTGAAHGDVSEPEDVEITRHNYVEMSDGVKLSASILRPGTGGPFPTVIIFSPYGDSIAQPLFRPAPELLEAGYAVVAADWRGTGCSGGSMELGTERFRDDGHELITWVAEQDWSTGKVGMAGPSARGTSQLFVAPGAPHALKAIAPYTFNTDLYRDMTHRGGIPHYLSAIGWSAIDQPRASARVMKVPNETCRANRRTQDRASALRSFAMLSHPHDGDEYQVGSAWDLGPEIMVPTMIFQSIYDKWTPATGIWMYPDLQGPKRLLLSNGGHGMSRAPGPLGEVVRWFDYWLKGIDNGIIDEPPVRVWLETDEPQTIGFERTFDAWPPAGAETLSFYLDADGTLADGVPSKRSSASYDFGPVSDAVTTRLPGFNFDKDWHTMPDAGLTYLSDPVEQSALLIGSGELVLQASVSTADTDLIGILSEVNYKGEITYLQHAMLRASQHGDIDRTVRPGRLWRRHAASTPLEPGKVHDFRLEIPPLAHPLRSGSRIRLDLVPVWVATQHLGWDLIPVPYAGTVTVHHAGDGERSAVLLTVVDVGTELPPAPACGSLEGQPCRKGGRSPDN